MNTLNRYMTLALTLYCLGGVGLSGWSDNLWYTYQIFLPHHASAEETKKEREEKAAIQEEQPQPTSRLKFERLSLIHGAPMIDLEVVRRLYDIGTLYNIKEGEAKARSILKKRFEDKAAEEKKEAVEEQQEAAFDARAISSILRPLVAEKAPASVQLVHAIFNRPNLLTTDASDFGISNRLSCCTATTIATFVGKTLATIEHAAQKSGTRKQPQFTLQKGVRAWIEQLTQENALNPTVTDAKINTTKLALQTVFNLALKAYIEDLSNESPFPSNTVHLVLLAFLYKHTSAEPQALRAYYRELAIIDPCLTTLTKDLKHYLPLQTAPAKEIVALATAHKEDLASLEKRQQEALAKHKQEWLTEQKKMEKESQSPTELKEFYQKIVLQELAIKVQQQKDRNKLKQYYAREQKKLETQLAPKTDKGRKQLQTTLLAQGEAAALKSPQAVGAFIHRVYEEIVFLELLPKGDFPPSFEYSDYTDLAAFVPSTRQFIRIKAPDAPYASCMENVIRNLINILAYLKKEKLISASALQSYLQRDEDDENKASTASLDLALTSFLHKHTDPTKVSQAAAHSDWSAVVSNIPYIAYTRISTSRTYNKWPGYIRIPAQDLKLNETLESFIAAQKYTLVSDDDKESVLYEMQPTFRNFIIILNNLLNLNLFDDQFPMTFANPDFVKTYLPKLLTKLHAKLNDTLSSDLDTINKADYSGEKCSITLEFIAKVGQCRITLDKDHGAFTTDRYKGAIKLPFFQENLAYYHQLPASALFFHHDNPDTICSLKDPKAMYLALFATKIDNPDVASALSENTCLFNHTNIFNLLRHCISRHADPLQRLKSILIFYDTYCKSKSDRELDGDIYKHALATIDEASTVYSNLDPAAASTLPPYILKLLKTLSVSKQYASVFMQFFPTFITTTPITYLDTPLLFHDAVFMDLILKHRQQIDQAIIQKIEDTVIGQAQKAMVMNPNEDNFALKKVLGVQAIEDLQQLVTNGFSNAYAKALEIALEASNTYYPSANDSIDNAANKLLVSLIQKGIGKNEMEEGLADNRNALHKRLFTLQMAEPKAGFYFSAAVPIINALIHKNWCIEKITDQLIDNLYLDELHTTGGDYLTIYVMKGDSFTPLINERIAMLKPLIEQKNDYACKEAVQAAQRLWQGKRWNDYDYEDDTKPAAKQEALGLAILLLKYNKDMTKSLPDDLLQAAAKALAAQEAKAPESNKDEKKQ